VEIVAVAIDAQGPAFARQYARSAGATYPVLVDDKGHLAELYDFRSIPNGWIIDGNGVIRFRQVGGFDIRKPDVARTVEAVIQGTPRSATGPAQAHPENAAALFGEAVRLLEMGKRAEALEIWVQAVEADPGNILIRKQFWRVLYPERFEPDVDFNWQEAQMDREGLLGIRRANSLPEHPA
jgi:hypothetical protein